MPDDPTDDELYDAMYPPESVEQLRQLIRDERDGELEFAKIQAVAARNGEPMWLWRGEDDRWDRRRNNELWTRLAYEGLPGASISVRLQPSDQGVVCSGLLIELDGRAVTARDLRALKLESVFEWGRRTAYATYAEFMVHDRAHPSRPGRPGYGDEHWAAVRERYEYWSRHDPRRVIKRMLDEYPEKERPSDATMRRWVKRVKEASDDTA